MEKIERALIKAEHEHRDENVAKCKKYKKLYEQKVDVLKTTLKQTRVKLAKYAESVAAAKSKKVEVIPSAKKPIGEKLTSSGSVKEVIAKLNEPMPVQPVLKLPFPVLNDTRDLNTILHTLETKYNELHKKKEINKKSIDALSTAYTPDKKLAEKNQLSADKLKQLDMSISLLIQRLVKQIEYLKLSISLESLRSRGLMADAEAIGRMSRSLNEMFNYMKNENMEYVLKQKRLAGDSSESGLESQGKRGFLKTYFFFVLLKKTTNDCT